MKENNKEYLRTILPHEEPMILIDDVIDYSLPERWLKSRVTIREDNIFYEKKLNGVSSLIGIEFMAQTIGCFVHLAKNHEKPQLGFLLGTRMYNNLKSVFELNSSYTIYVREEYMDSGISSFSCIISDEKENEVASATITAYQSDDIERKFLNA